MAVASVPPSLDSGVGSLILVNSPPPYSIVNSHQRNTSTFLMASEDLAPNGMHRNASFGNNSEDQAEVGLGLGPESRIVLIVLYTVTIILSVGGNLLVIIVFTVGKRSRTDLSGFLINLAVSDLIMAIFCLPFTFTMTMLSNWIFSAPMCPIVLYMQLVSVTASVCTNMAIGVDRFWVVTFPLRSRFTKSRSKVVIALIWAVSLGLSSVQLVVGRTITTEVAPGVFSTECLEMWPEPQTTWRRAYTFFILTLTYLLPLGILSITYGIVGIKLWQRTAPGNADEARDMQQHRSKRKVIKMLVVVVLLFGICWLPLHIFFLVLDLNPGILQQAPRQFFSAIYVSVHWLAMSNSFVNPIIYSFLNDSFRHDLKRLIWSWFPCCRCLPCLKIHQFTREGTLHGYSRADHRESSSASLRPNCHSNRKMISVRVNGCGTYETELSVRNSLLRHPGNVPKKDYERNTIIQNGQKL